MKLKLYSALNDLLELDIVNVRPNLQPGEIFFEGEYHPWHASWEPLHINAFHEDYHAVKNKIIDFYKKETSNLEKKSGHAELITDYNEVWTLNNCKVYDCKSDDIKMHIDLILFFNEVMYLPAKPKGENDD